jgi:hypothetical protein
MKEAWKRQRYGSNTNTGFIVQEGALWRGTPARELEPHILLKCKRLIVGPFVPIL